jgi:hypothetical protein
MKKVGTISTLVMFSTCGIVAFRYSGHLLRLWQRVRNTFKDRQVDTFFWKHIVG